MSKQRKKLTLSESYTQLIAGIEAVSNLHSSIPTAEETKECIYNLNNLLARLAEYGKISTSHDKPNKSTKKDHQPNENTLQDRRDRLDREGVMLWNRSTTLKHARLILKNENEGDREDRGSAEEERNGFQSVVELIRLAAARLVDLGSNKPMKQTEIIRVLELYTKSAFELSTCGDLENATVACEAAAEYEQNLSRTSLDESGARKSASKALVQYSLSRARLARLQKNVGVTQFMMKEATKELLLHDCSPRDIEQIASQSYEFAVSLLSKDPVIPNPQKKKGKSANTEKATTDKDQALADSDRSKKLKEANEWLQMNLRLVTREGCMGDRKQAAKSEMERRFREIHLKALKALAQASLDAASASSTEFPSKAEATLDEILKLEISVKVCRHKLKLLVRRSAGEGEIESVLEKCLRSMDCTQDNVNQLIKEVHQLPSTRKDFVLTLMAKMISILLERSDDGGASWTYMPILSFCYGLNNSVKDLKRLQCLLASVAGLDDTYMLSSEATFACQGMIWKHGDQALKNEKYDLAAEWYLVSTQSIFRPLQESNFPKARRKAALSFIHANEVEKAEETIRRSKADTASDHYVLFLCAAAQGNEGKAIRAVRSMSTSSDFQMEMLLWAARQAKVYDMNELFKFSLQVMLEATKKSPLHSKGIDGLMLIRSLIKSAAEEFQSAKDEQEADLAFEPLLQQIQAAVEIIQWRLSANTKEKWSTSIRADVAWIYKTTLNLALSGLSTWPPHRIVPLCSLAADLADYTATLAEEDTGPLDGPEAKQAAQNSATLRFVAITSELVSARSNPTAETNLSTYERLYNELVDLLNRISSSIAADLQTNLQVSAIAFQFELLTYLARWQDAKELVDKAAAGNMPVKLFQKIADLACVAKDCPAQVVTLTLEAVMNTASQDQTLNAAKMSKFVRAIVASSLERSDHEGAHRYIQSALSLIQHASDYPRSEIEWLATTAWNNGIEAFPASSTDGFAWCEQALALAQHISGYADMREAMVRYYQQLCHQYGTGFEEHGENLVD